MMHEKTKTRCSALVYSNASLRASESKQEVKNRMRSESKLRSSAERSKKIERVTVTSPGRSAHMII